ncbi:hypothetical protein LTR53_010918 [Teratosphaeriaceae sp. CCFEE 6253]|nr:hypothetical protein LTR53_010918 [Teratosphaeriaceae sp. CCFEE 6253]
MHNTISLKLVLWAMCTTTALAWSTASQCYGFPSTLITFSSQFREPQPPLLKPEFKTAFLQHKWDDQNHSHIATGFLYNSPSQRLVVINEAFDGAFGSSIFNYSNTTTSGLVDDTLTLFNTNGTFLSLYRDYVESSFPLFGEDLLVKGGAVFTGLVDRLLVGQVASWSLLYQGAIPATVFVDACNVVVGFDYWAPNLRTRAVTTFFDTTVGRVTV